MRSITLLISLSFLSCGQERSSRELSLQNQVDSIKNELELIKENNEIPELNKNTNSQKSQNQLGKSSRWNTDEPTWVDKNGNRYTADEIKRLRENDQGHIYRTHGDPVH